jgi:hypothetical protein
LPLCGALAVRMIRRRPSLPRRRARVAPQHPRARNISWAWAPLSGESDCRRRRSDNSASIRPVPLRGRRRIILTASAPQNGKALPHVAKPGSQDREGPVGDRKCFPPPGSLLTYSVQFRRSRSLGGTPRLSGQSTVDTASRSRPLAISLIRAKISLIARFNSLQGRKKFPVRGRRELAGKPLD